jgi:hypothetical protein
MVGGPGFRIVEAPQDAKWYPIGDANTVMVGQIVKYATVQGVIPLGASTTAGGEVSANGVPFGIVIAVNNRTPLSNSTYSTQYATQVNTQGTVLARDFFGVEGMHGKSDPQAFALVELLTMGVSVIEGPLFKSTYGTAPGVVTCTTADSNGLSGMVHGAGDAAAYGAGINMYYCRSGNNAGLYRSANAIASSATTPTFLQPWPKIWGVGDTFVLADCGLGKQRIQLDAYSMFIDNAANTTSGNCYSATVLSMDLTQAGRCSVQFRFDSYLS